MTFTARRRLPILLVALAALVLSLVVEPVQAQDNTVPAPPTGLTVAEVAHDSVNLTWDDPGDASITHYQVLRRDRDRDDLGVFTTITDNTGSATTSYTDTSVEPERRYVYRVVAVNAHGPSPRSGFVRAEPPADKEPEGSPSSSQTTARRGARVTRPGRSISSAPSRSASG